VRKLWDSWDEDGLVLDVEAGRYADMDAIAPIDHHGRHFDVRGPITLPPSEQGHPVIYHAGVSDDVWTLTARTAEAMFTAVVDVDAAAADLAEIRSRAVRFGRAPDSFLFLPGFITTLGGTEEEALRRRRELDELANVTDQVGWVAARLGLPPDALELDRPVPEPLREALPVPSGHGRHAVVLAKSGLTVRDIIALGGGSGHVLGVGSPEQVADRIEAWFRAGAVDGFTIMPDVTFDGLPAFVDHVVPILQRKGVFRTEYRGRTLREHHGLPFPAARRRTAVGV
jgi:alkanesulfonate monooxygenase SsuD/methylene tetrahydromethanopterin reductase-like flavin-dependent oxidoreductase (luciferase family)